MRAHQSKQGPPPPYRGFDGRYIDGAWRPGRQGGRRHQHQRHAEQPFGGEKNSGLGRFNGEWVIHEFTTDHWVTVQHTPPAFPF
jgi:acyl-CoA reductase-like NAD-dependent aldehyde dehydrogenase